MEPLKPNDPSQLGDWSITGRLGEGEDSVIYLGVRGVAGSEQAAIKLIEDDSFEFESFRSDWLLSDLLISCLQRCA